MTARDLAEQMALLADVLGVPRSLPWPEVARIARERIEQGDDE